MKERDEGERWKREMEDRDGGQRWRREMEERWRTEMYVDLD